MMLGRNRALDTLGDRAMYIITKLYFLAARKYILIIIYIQYRINLKYLVSL